MLRTESERYGPSDKHLLRCIGIVFNASLKFYRAKRGSGAKALDVSSFFRRRGLDVDFEKFWKSSANNRRGTFRRAWRSEEHTSELQSHSFISYAVFCLQK